MAPGDRLEELRKARGWTQRELADKVGVSERTYQLWRSGRAEPYGKHRKKLAEVLGVPVAYLTDERGRRRAPSIGWRRSSTRRRRSWAGWGRS